jgi:hypothetical protein
MLHTTETAGGLVGRGSAGQLPLHPLLTPLLPWSGGLRRGATVTAVGAMSLVLILLGAATACGGYAAAIGLPQLGALAAIEHDVCLERLALVPYPGPAWPDVVAAVLDGVDMVVVNPSCDVPVTIARGLAARARQRSAVLVCTSSSWPGADLGLTAVGHHWRGLGQGRGRLRGHEMIIRAAGRGAATRPREITVPVPLPDPSTLPASGHSRGGLDTALTA